MIRIILADDHDVVRGGLRTILSGLPDAEVVAEARNGLEAIAQVKKHKPDLLFLDAAMPHAKGIEVLTDTRRWSPDTRVILFTGFTSAGIFNDWLAAGVDAILLKTCPPEDITEALHAVLSGGNYLARAVAEILEAASVTQTLTARELEVLSLIATGHQTARIAERLCISPKTVEKHRTSLMTKLNVNSLAALLAYALREGLLDQERQL